MPKWATPERASILRDLATAVGEGRVRCIQNHVGCVDVEHYQEWVINRPPGTFNVRKTFHRRAVRKALQNTPLRRVEVWTPAEKDGVSLGYLTKKYLLEPATYDELQDGKVKHSIVLEPVQYDDLYNFLETCLVTYWKGEDRDREKAERLAEGRRLHDMYEITSFRSHFISKYGEKPWDPVTQEQFFDQQPDYYLLRLGYDAGKGIPVAEIRIPSTLVHLTVNISDCIRGLSKNKRKKALKYDGTFPPEIQSRINEECRQAALHYRQIPV